MTVSTRKDDDLEPVAPPSGRRRGGAAIWIGLGLIAILALSMFAFFLDGGALEGPDADEGVLIDDGGLGNG